MFDIMKQIIRRRHNLLSWCLFAALTVVLIQEFCNGLTSVWNRQFTPSPSVKLILAATMDTDLEWIRHLNVRNLQVIPYIADDPDAPYHPPANRGNEAMIYLTYLYEFYDKLPDISIFTHGEDLSWHVDSALEYSTAYAIEHLDLQEVIRRQYLNLRISWKYACPDWINTSITIFSPEFNPNLKAEEAFMRAAFEENFPDDTVPPLLSQPCCSQFAVTKEAIQSVSRENYKLHMGWLQDTLLKSEISGRIWEHLWQWLFLRKTVDCPIEHKALCRQYHICFESEEDWERWKEHDDSRNQAVQDRNMTITKAVNEEEVIKLDHQIKEYNDRLEHWKQKAMDRGESEEKRTEIAGDL